MKSLPNILAALALVGCNCTTPPTADVGIDAYAPDVGLDAPIPDSPIPDASFVLPDVPVRAPLCGPITATSCPVQSAATVTACASGEGAVFFDGAHCQETPSLACGVERGAFGSFEECAVVCAATHCDASKLFDSQDRPLECETPFGASPVCGGGASASTPVPGWASCDSFAPLECYGSFVCARTPSPGDTAEVWEFFRRASLLPFVSRLVCDNGV